MNNIYVDELPKCCDECEHKQVTNKTKDGMYTSYACPFKDGKLAFGKSAPMRKCPLKSLSDRLAEERKKVVKEAKKLVVESTCYDTEEEARNHLYDLSASEVLELLDQVREVSDG